MYDRWDAVNFSHGANPPRSEWKHQPERSAAERERAFQYLESLVVYAKTLRNLRFVTATEAYALYPDAAQVRVFDPREMAEIASEVKGDIRFQVRGGYALSACEIFALLNQYVANFVRRGAGEPARLDSSPRGPSSRTAGAPAGNTQTTWSQFSRTSLDVESFLKKNRAIPSAVWFGAAAVPPESYLVALASVARELIAKGQPPQFITSPPAALAAGQYVAKDSLSLWEWMIFPPGFHSQHLMELARLQAWTLKPAILDSPS